MKTRAQIKYGIRTWLNRTPAYQGICTDEKMDLAIEDSMNFVAAEMMQAGQGWLTKIAYLAGPLAGEHTVDLPTNIGIITALRYLIGNRYVPLTYDDDALNSQLDPTSNLQQYPSKWRIVDGKIYFNPSPMESVSNSIQIEYSAYPASLLADGEIIDPSFDLTCCTFVQWRSMNLILGGTMRSPNSTFLKHEADWYEKMMQIVAKRCGGPIYVKSFDC